MGSNGAVTGRVWEGISSVIDRVVRWEDPTFYLRTGYCTDFHVPEVRPVKFGTKLSYICFLGRRPLSSKNEVDLGLRRERIISFDIGLKELMF